MVALVILTLAGASQPACAGSPPSAPIAQELPDIVAPLLNAVVNISVLKKAGSDPTDPPNQIVPDRAQGSGFVVSADGFIVTNTHVVDGGYDIRVSFVDGATFRADVIATNRRPDLALLKINAGRPLASVPFGNSDKLRIGETVFAIGNPLGLGSSLTVGIVSALNRDANMTMIDDFIQTDAAINHGNSGGPLFNLRGEVIGVNYALLAPGQQTGSAGLGLAIPSNDASWIVDEMRRHGAVRSGFVGLRLQEVNADIQAALGLPSRTGGIVTGVLPNAPATGLIEEGDVVVALDGRAPHDVRALLRSLSATPPGTTVALTVWRRGGERVLKLRLADWPAGVFDPVGPQPVHAAIAPQVPEDLGFRLMEEDGKAVRRSAFHTGQPAVALADVVPNSPAADLRLVPGDIIVRVGQDRVTRPGDVDMLVKKARGEGRKSILMLVEADGVPCWVVVPLTGR
jgi:serine protease Do